MLELLLKCQAPLDALVVQLAHFLALKPLHVSIVMLVRTPHHRQRSALNVQLEHILPQAKVPAQIALPEHFLPQRGQPLV